MKYYRKGESHQHTNANPGEGWEEISAKEFQAAHDSAHTKAEEIDKILEEKAAEA